jgi:hypothetical protein
MNIHDFSERGRRLLVHTVQNVPLLDEGLAMSMYYNEITMGSRTVLSQIVTILIVMVLTSLITTSCFCLQLPAYFHNESSSLFAAVVRPLVPCSISLQKDFPPS